MLTPAERGCDYKQHRPGEIGPSCPISTLSKTGCAVAGVHAPRVMTSKHGDTCLYRISRAMSGVTAGSYRHFCPGGCGSVEQSGSTIPASPHLTHSPSDTFHAQGTRTGVMTRLERGDALCSPPQGTPCCVSASPDTSRPEGHGSESLGARELLPTSKRAPFHTHIFAHQPQLPSMCRHGRGALPLSDRRLTHGPNRTTRALRTRDGRISRMLIVPPQGSR